MTTTNATTFRKNLFTILDRTVRYNEPVFITAKTGNAVLISEDEYRGMLETLHLMTIPGMREKLLRGKDTPESECISEEDIEW